MTQRQHLQQIAKTTGKPVDTGPKCPEELIYLWEWFLEVFAYEPLSFTEIKAWTDLTGKKLKDWEILLIREMSCYA